MLLSSEQVSLPYPADEDVKVDKEMVKDTRLFSAALYHPSSDKNQ